MSVIAFHTIFAKTASGYEVIEQWTVPVRVDANFDWQDVWVSETHKIEYF